MEAVSQAVSVRQQVRGRRIRTNLTLLTETLDRLDELVVRFGCTRGPIIDKCVMILHASVKSGRVLCCHGQACVANRVDVPEVF